SRGAIRRRFEERFTARRMACEYLAVYRGLMDKRRPRRSAHHAGEFLAPSIAGASADKAALKKSCRSGTKGAFNGEVTRQRNQWPSHFEPPVGRRLLMTSCAGSPLARLPQPITSRIVCQAGNLEGIVSKRKDLPYRSGRSPDWLNEERRCTGGEARRWPVGRRLI